MTSGNAPVPSFQPLPERDERERSARILGGKVAYWDFARAGADSPQRRPEAVVVMVHGFRGDHHGMMRMVTELPQYRVVVPDLPGFGKSPRLAKRQDIDGYVEFLDLFIESLELPAPPVVLGHSFGSIVAAHFAARHPGKAWKLVLVNPIADRMTQGLKGIVAQGARGLHHVAGLAPEKLGRLMFRNPLVVRSLSIAMTKTKDRELRKEIHAEHDAHFSSFTDNKGLVEAFDASVRHGVREVAGQLALPTLVVAGEKDDFASVAAQESLVSGMPNATLRVIPGVGHLIHYEAPLEAARIIGEFVESR